MKARKKLNNRSGFTLAETLLAVLILLLVSGIVATGIPAARNAYLNVVVGANAQALLSTTAAALRDELGTAWNVESKDNALTYYSADTGAISILSKSDETIILQEYVSQKGFNEKTGVSVGNQRPLVSDRAATSDLTVTYDSVNYSEGDVTFTKLCVKHGAKELATLDELVIHVLSAVPTAAPVGP